MIVDIQKFKQNILKDIKKNLNILQKKSIIPRLDIIIIGNDQDAINYADIKKKLGESLGFQVYIDKFKNNEIDNQKLEDLILQKNADKNIHGIIIESPVSPNIDYAKATEKIVFFKDVDGLNSKNIGFLRNNQQDKGIMPATPLACIQILNSIFSSLEGKKICLIGDGRTVGKALGRMLLNKGATLIVCHKKTENIRQFTLNSEIIICAAGEVNLLNRDMLNPNSIIIDVGTNWTKNGLVGDADYNNIKKYVKYISPVPGGVGVLTTVILFQNLIKATNLCMEYDHFDLSLNDFEKILSSSDLPGGGSLSALTTIHGANLLTMVCNLTKENIENIQNIKLDINNIIPKLKLYYNIDMQIFNDFLQAMKMPKDDEDQKTLRQQKMQDLLKQSCELLIKIIKINIKFIKIGKKIFEIGNKSAISDVLVAQNLFEANIKSCSDLMSGNVFYIKDQAFLQKIDKYLKY